jgi:hypothetical protein
MTGGGRATLGSSRRLNTMLQDRACRDGWLSTLVPNAGISYIF